MKIKAFACGVAALVLFSLCPRLLHAADRYSMISVHPNIEGESYFFMQQSRTLPQFVWDAGLMMLYYNDLLNIKWETVVVGPGGSRTVRVDERHGIDHLFYDYFHAAVGLNDWMTLAVDFPLFMYYGYGWTTANVSSSSNQYFKPGDLWVSAKFKLLDIDTHAVGIALIPAFSVPTGKDEHFLGDQNVTGEGKIVIDTAPMEKLHVAFNMALHTRERVVINDIAFRNTLKFALGANYRVADDILLIGEIESHTVTNDFYGSKRTSPAEVRAGARWSPGGGPWKVGGGASVGLVSGVGMPRAGAFVSVGYRGARKPQKEVAKLGKFEGVEEIDQCVRVSADDGDQTYRYLVLCNAYFNHNKAKARDHRIILGIIDLIQNARGKVTVDIRGWTDPSGTRAYNKDLAARRASYVAKAIMNGLGKKSGKADIRTHGIGEDGDRPPERARRVDVLMK